MQQVLRDARAFEDHAHQHEQGHGNEGAVLHDRTALDAAGQGAEQRLREDAERDADEGEQHGDAAEGEGDRVAHEQCGDGGREHQEGEDDLKLHERPPLPRGVSPLPAGR